jgi:hypothetical protein
MAKKAHQVKIQNHNKEIDGKLKKVADGKLIAQTRLEYETRIGKSVKEIEEGKGIIFTMEELYDYIRQTSK